MLFMVLKEHFMMQKRTLYSLLLISFMVVFGWTLASANDVTISNASLSRCANGTLNVTANVTEDSVSAVEVVLVISKTTNCAFMDSVKVVWNPAFTELPDRVIDYTMRNGTSPDTIRFAAMRLTVGGLALKKGLKVLATLTFKASDCCPGGIVTVAGGEFDYPNPTCPIVTQFVNAANAQIVQVAVNPGTVTITNAAPVLTHIADTTLHWGQSYQKTAVATDADKAFGCEAVTYSVVGPAAMTIDANNGNIFWSTQKADVCTHDVIVIATDECGAADADTFTICVQNTPPVFTLCPETQVMVNGDVIHATVKAKDPDNAQAALIFTKLSGPAWVTVLTVNDTTGDITLAPAPPDVLPGTYEVGVKVSDGLNTCPCSPSNADTCYFNVEVRQMGIAIQKQHGPLGDGVLWGTETTVDIQKLPGSAYPIGGYDFLIQYDNSVLTLMGVTAGSELAVCEWEYFTYRFGPFGNCGSGCPSGMVKLVAIAETNNGTHRPICYLETDGSIAQLAQLTFLVKNDRNLECMFVPIRFIWIDCTDNALSNKAGDTLLISKHVYDWVKDGLGYYLPIEGQSDGTFPTIYGAPASCNVQTLKGWPFRMVDFYNGGVDIICAENVDDRGDINLNGIAYEISDAVMFTNYFIQGMSAFPHPVGSMAASDVNGDGLTLTVADLVYLIRVVVGDVSALPKVVVEPVKADMTNDHGVLSINSTEPVAAVYINVAGNVQPSLKGNATNMSLNYSYSAETSQTRILVLTPYSEGAKLEGFTGTFIDLGTNATPSVEAATITGQPLALKLVPINYALNQNYPNPFNPSTKISFDLPKAGAWTLTVFNIQGQVVDTYSGVAESAGSYDVTFDGNGRSSGMYLYKLTAGDYTSVKKMVMIK
jgi:hypothetical protein